MKGLGNYADGRRVERKPARLVSYQGSRAHIRFHDGTTYAIPSEPLRKLAVKEGGPFFVVTTWAGAMPIDMRVELPAPAREPTGRMRTPKMYVRDGRRLVTRKPGGE